MPGRTVKSRAIVCFVDDNEHLIQQALALRESWLCVQCADTDMVVFGPSSVLAQLPDDVVKIEQRAVADDPEWFSYRYGNSPACLNGVGGNQLDRYDHVLLTDVDTFITPAWNRFYPSGFVCGNGGYSNDDIVRRKIQEIAQEFGLQHRGLSNTGSTWYGPTKLVRRVSAVTEMLTRYILSRQFRTDDGVWPSWYRGVTLLYASEIAINHCAPDATKTDQLDYFSTSRASVQDHAHIHCWHTDEKFSKHWFMMRRYTAEDAENLNLDVIADYAMEMSFRSLKGTPAKNVFPVATLSRAARKLRLDGLVPPQVSSRSLAADDRFIDSHEVLRALLMDSGVEDRVVVSQAAEHVLLNSGTSGAMLWDTLAADAEYHGIVSMIEPMIGALAKKLPEAVPDDVRRTLVALKSRHRRASVIREQCIDQLLSSFSNAGIPIILLKGAALAHLIYPSPDLRPMVDVDVLIDPAEMKRAVTIARKLGFVFSSRHPSRFSGRLHHLPAAVMNISGFDISLEIHLDALSPDSPNSLTFASLTSEPKPFQRGRGPDGLALGHTDMLRHLASHTFEPARRVRMKHLYDLWRYQKAFVDEIDWRTLEKSFPQASVALQLARSLFESHRSPAAPNSGAAPVAAGLGMVPLSEIATMPFVDKLAALFDPPAWWLHGFYGIPMDSSLLMCRIIWHPLTLARWLTRRLVARTGLSHPFPRRATEGLAERIR